MSGMMTRMSSRLQGVPKRVVDVLRHLGVGAHRELPAETVEGGDARQRLQRRRAVPVDLEILPHHPVGFPERRLGIPVFQGSLPGHVGTQFFIDERRILAGHGLVDVADGRQDVVVHRNGFQDVFGRAPVPGRDGAHGLTYVADLVHRSGVFRHGLLQAGGVAARPKRFGVPLHVLGRHHGKHVLPALGGLGVHPENARVGVGAPYEHRLQHAGFGEIVGVLTPSGYVPRPFLAARGKADIFIRASHFTLLRGFLHRCHDLHVSRAHAQIPRQTLANLLFAGVRVLAQQRVGRHDHSGRAVSALEAVVLDEGLLNGVQRVALRQTLDGGDLLAVGLHRKHEARFHQRAVQLHGARAAFSDNAADVRAGEADGLPQKIGKELPRLHFLLVQPSVDGHPNRLFHGLIVAPSVFGSCARRFPGLIAVP